MSLITVRGNGQVGKGRGDAGGSPASGSAGKSDSLLLEEKDDLTGTGKNPLRKRATPTTSNIKMKQANRDERTLIAVALGSDKNLSERDNSLPTHPAGAGAATHHTNNPPNCVLHRNMSVGRDGSEILGVYR